MLPDIVFIANGDARSEIVAEATEKGNVPSNLPPPQSQEGARGRGRRITFQYAKVCL